MATKLQTVHELSRTIGRRPDKVLVRDPNEPAYALVAEVDDVLKSGTDLREIRLTGVGEEYYVRVDLDNTLVELFSSDATDTASLTLLPSALNISAESISLTGTTSVDTIKIDGKLAVSEIVDLLALNQLGEFSNGVLVGGNLAVGGTVDGVDIAAFKSDYDSHVHAEYTERASDEVVGGNWEFEQGLAIAVTDQTADGSHDVVLFSDTPYDGTPRAHNAAYSSKLKIYGGSNQTRHIEIYQEVGGDAYLLSDFSDFHIVADGSNKDILLETNGTGSAKVNGDIIWDAGNFDPTDYALATHNHDSDYVKLTTDQAITGTKTFRNTPNIESEAATTHTLLFNKAAVGTANYASVTLDESTGLLTISTVDDSYSNDCEILLIAGDSANAAKFDGSTTAGNTRFLIYDVDNATLERVTVGVADSGGTGYKVLRIPN